MTDSDSGFGFAIPQEKSGRRGVKMLAVLAIAMYSAKNEHWLWEYFAMLDQLPTVADHWQRPSLGEEGRSWALLSHAQL